MYPFFLFNLLLLITYLGRVWRVLVVHSSSSSGEEKRKANPVIAWILEGTKAKRVDESERFTSI
jgi:hypothetical protein